MTASPAAPAPRALAHAVPAVFVIIWSTGFVVARYAMPHAPPLTFLCLRYALSVLAFGVWVGVARATWPRGRSQWLHLGVTGVLMHAGYLGGVWAAVKGGLGAGVAAMIVGLQPLLTAIWISSTRSPVGRGNGNDNDKAGHPHISARQWLGLVLGLAGVVLVLWHRLQLGQLGFRNLALVALALASITAGTLYQKRWVAPCDVRTANTVQLVAALAVTAPLAAFEAGHIDFRPEVVGALAWSVFVLTLGGSSLLYLLIQRGAAAAVASLMYLVPPCTALLAWWLFDETLGTLALAGLACTAAGVALVVREARAPATLG